MVKLELHVDRKAYRIKPTGREIGGIKSRVQKSIAIELTTGELVEKIGEGYAVSPAVMSGVAASDWISQQIFMVDIDNETKGIPLLTPHKALAICKEHGLPCAFYYYTYGSTKQKPKFRMVFIARSPVRSEKWRGRIMDTLIRLFEQSDTACRNADRIFFGTNGKVLIVDSDARFTQKQIEYIYNSTTITVDMTKAKKPDSSSKATPFSLQALKETFDFLSFLKERNGPYRLSGNTAYFKNCEICKHKDDLAYYMDTNTFYCFSKDGEVGGSIIDYLMAADKLTQKQAIDKFKHKLCGLKREVDEWEPPVPFDEVVLPHFPVGCLPPLLRDWTKAVAANTATPVDMAAVAVLAVVATAVQGKFTIAGKPDHIEPLNLYILIVAQPGERKSAIMRLVTRPINQYENEENKNRQALIDEQETRLEALKRQIEQCEKSGEVEEAIRLKQDYREIEAQQTRPLRLFADDVTPEALTSLLADNNGRIAIISSEGGLFDILAGKYSSSNKISIDTVLKAHSSDTIRVDRKGRSTEIINDPALTMLLTAQENVLEGLMQNDAFRARGLTARILYCKPTSTIGSRQYETPPIPPQLMDSYSSMVQELLSIPETDDGMPHMLKLDEDAFRASSGFFNQLEKKLRSELNDMNGWAEKLHGEILRIAGLLHCAIHEENASEETVSEKTIKQAVKIGRYFLAHARYTYLVMGTDKRTQGAKWTLKRLEQEAKKQVEREFSKYDIFRLSRKYCAKTDDILPFLEILMAHGYIREKTNDTFTGGRPKGSTYYLNPLHFDKL